MDVSNRTRPPELVSLRVALATCAELPALAEDDPLLLEALRARGVEAEAAVWDDAELDWDGYELVVIRSTWDYPRKRERFVEWADRVPHLLNPAEVVRWNTDKRYLSGLPHAVATEFLDPGDRLEPPADEYVIKPAVSVGSLDTERFTAAERGRAEMHLKGIHDSGRTAMVQPYLSDVEQAGESALIFIAGRFSHAIRKGPMLRCAPAGAQELYRQEEIAPRSPSATERTVAEEILASLPWHSDDLLYARVDLIPGPAGEPLLVELELTEPSLFLSQGEGAVERLSQAIIERAQ